MKPQLQFEKARSDTSPVVTAPPRPLESAALFGSLNEILIAHHGETYRLRRTRQGKLILTK
jgi:hemin uptake protein HemP